MKTKEHQARESGAKPQEEIAQENRDSSSRRDSSEVRARKLDPEGHWQELHQSGNGGVAGLVERMKRRMNGTSLAAVAGVAATGFAIGALAVSQRRQGFGERLLGSLAPAGRRMTKLGVRNLW